MRKVHPLLEKVEQDLRQVVEGLGYEYVMAKLSGPLRRPRLAVYVDRPGGVTLDDCQRISERLSVLLDMLDPIPGSYELIVSSPGLDRPLVREEDFVRFAGRLASVKRTTSGGKKETIQGRLLGVEAGAVVLQHGETTEAIPLEDIEEAHVVYEWDS
ncbi:MAG: ribosome maturation factor RimP [Armatimonadetes bacterium]|nr:ribosome maturation factor RimP [Armatimonadota bacterium]